MRSPRLLPLLAPALLGAACAELPEEVADEPEPPTVQEAVVEDGLADAYTQFKQTFTAFGFDRQFRIGYGFHPGLSSERLAAESGRLPKGAATLDFNANRVTATLTDAPPAGSFDLWLVKNVAGSGRTVKPETGDQFLKIGTFGGAGAAFKTLDVPISSTNIKFDLDLVVVTRKGQHPTASRVAVGARTLFEKRFFRERNGKTLDPVSGTIATNVETTDRLVGRGAQLFFNEKFSGNGRTCGTCHRADRNLSIDVPFIARLPQSDPLFVAETNPALARLENPTLMRNRGLILENLDGFEDPTNKFVMRGVPHTLALNQTNDISAGIIGVPSSPPDQRVGWSGDGAPGRGTMTEFAFGAVIQHFTKNLARRPGTDFRVPTQEELDALEAFQLFTGRQKLVDVRTVTPREARALSGRDLFLGQGACTACHGDLTGSTTNSNFDTGVASLASDLPFDNGFLDGAATFGSNAFNPPPVLEAADSAPMFHNNTAPDIESAVSFYVSSTFANAPNGFFIALSAQQQSDIAAFLRVVNAAENIRQVRKRVQFVRNNRSGGNTSLLDVAIADTQDAIDVLVTKGLNPAATNQLADVKNTLLTARANADANRPPFMDHALIFLGLARTELFAANPNNQF